MIRNEIDEAWIKFAVLLACVVCEEFSYYDWNNVIDILCDNKKAIRYIPKRYRIYYDEMIHKYRVNLLREMHPFLDILNDGGYPQCSIQTLIFEKPSETEE